jgi:GNAT superfamily N-acetyltransferase
VKDVSETSGLPYFIPEADVIRPATVTDVPTIARLIRGLAEYERLAADVVFDEDRLRQHLFGPRPFAEVLLAEEAGVVVGFALFFHNYSTFVGKPGIYLEDLFVEPAHRGRGHGKALLREVARAAVERDCGRLEWAVLKWNEPAIRFYRSLGAIAMDGWDVYRLTGETLRSVGVQPSPGSDVDV